MKPKILVVDDEPDALEVLGFKLREAGCTPVNNVVGLKVAVENGVGIATLPDYLVEGNENLVRLFSESDAPALDAYFVYPEELRSVARIQVFRDFLLANAQRWKY